VGSLEQHLVLHLSQSVGSLEQHLVLHLSQSVGSLGQHLVLQLSQSVGQLEQSLVHLEQSLLVKYNIINVILSINKKAII
jgi:hypothetical protein